MAAVAGAGLATCGALLQAVTRNALAEPYLLGISSGASTGAVFGDGHRAAARGLMYWLTGSLAAARWPAVALCVGVTVIALVVARLIASDLDAFAFGAVASASLGVPVTAVRSIALVATAAVTAVVVSAVGAIGFVGLIVPHAVRALIGPQHRRLLPASAFGGAVFLLLADLVGRIVLAPRELRSLH